LRHEETLRRNELGGLIADNVYGPSVTAVSARRQRIEPGFDRSL
jgi:hypothetical protein